MVAMKETELRLGNSINLHGEECTVRAIGKGNITIGAEGYKSERVSINSIKPIPLTEEWLVKFWFKYGESKEHGYLWLHCKMGELYVRPSYLDGFYWGFDNDNEINNQNNIEHVHSLQNLYFALTGQELEISE
jgi:hypothetical protein